jgi:hypothetical protein
MCSRDPRSCPKYLTAKRGCLANRACFGFSFNRPNRGNCGRVAAVRSLVLVRNELDRAFEWALSEVCGIEFEPDEKDGTFLD